MLEKERETVCFRAMGTKAAPGKGRELRPKWKNLSWVLQNLSFMDFSAPLGQKKSLQAKRAERFQSWVTEAFPILLSLIFLKP